LPLFFWGKEKWRTLKSIIQNLKKRLSFDSYFENKKTTLRILIENIWVA
jgi:hypothetical protein